MTGEQGSSRAATGTFRSAVISRRRALQILGGAAAGVTLVRLDGLSAAASGLRVMQPSVAPRRVRQATPAPDFTAQVTRAVDMLALGFEFYNLRLNTTTTPARLVVIAPSQPALMVVVFPPQHVGEQALSYPDPPPAGWPPDPPYAGILGNPSWLAFEVPGALDFTLPSLLTWTSLVPQLVPVAVPTTGAGPTQPSALQTSIEAPWGLVLSPDARGTWHHSTKPNTHARVTEVWQTWLGRGPRSRPGSGPTSGPCGHPVTRANPPPARSRCRSRRPTGPTSSRSPPGGGGRPEDP